MAAFQFTPGCTPRGVNGLKLSGIVIASVGPVAMTRVSSRGTGRSSLTADDAAGLGVSAAGLVGTWVGTSTSAPLTGCGVAAAAAASGPGLAVGAGADVRPHPARTSKAAAPRHARTKRPRVRRADMTFLL